ncbi:WG repeat-containing protein [Fredinandcohnia quinoae]|uniref:WG repeat-containing protein n=1 Tax=Fredinandcohnia quinoae TaxID=2918902 RepID=A0AAW5E2C0_9BACI|nr:WG repeat-containing protein [Fredinandcohnia sp. SECRCQ15]MCH1624222.1 WG repeat-containing protein [Fredinandcohnia sp. SECRCQ15]
MRFKNWKVATSLLVLSGALLTGCQDTENESKSSKGTTKVETTQKEKESNPSLAEQGFEITTVISYGENLNLVSLEKDGSEYVGTIDDNFNWLMEPTNEYKFTDLEFHDGLAVASIPETREIIVAEDPDAQLYGYINTKGEWVIDPIFRSVNIFSNGVAVVNTVEEDRDDLSNSRTIVIDTKGMEVGELAKEGFEKLDLDDSDYFYGSFQGDYLYTSFGFFNKQGNYTEVYEEEHEDEGSHFLVLDGKIIKEDADGYIRVEGLDGRLIKSFDKTGDFTLENGEDPLYHNLFLVSGDVVGGEGDAVVDSNFNVQFQPDGFTMGLAENLIFIRESSDNLEDEVYTQTGDFFDYTGKKVFSVTNMVGAVYGDKYFVKGNEYYKLVDINGNVLIDESKKITDTEAALFDEGGDDNTPSKKLVRIEYRENAKDSEPNEALLNVDTLKIVDLEDLLKIETSGLKVKETQPKEVKDKQEAKETNEAQETSEDLFEHKIDYLSFVDVLTLQIKDSLTTSPQGIEGVEELLFNWKQLQEQLEGLNVPNDPPYQDFHQKLIGGLPPLIEGTEELLDMMQAYQSNPTSKQEVAINDLIGNLEYDLINLQSKINVIDGTRKLLQDALKQ